MSNLTKIYLVTNCFGDPNKVYIGKEKYPKRRKRLTDHQQTFGKDIIFTYIDEIQSLQSKDWKPFESFWIEYFRQLGFDLQNKNGGGGGRSFTDEETKNKISKPVIFYCKNTYKYIGRFNSALEASLSLNLSHNNITQCCLKKQHTVKNYIFRYENDPLPTDFKLVKNYGKPVIYFCKYTNKYLGEFKSSLEASKILNLHHSNVNNCCLGKGKTVGNYIFKHKNI